MPYRNISYVKLKLELLTDIRFTDKLDDEGKLVYMGLLLLAGHTRNQVPNDPVYIKRNLNLNMTEDKIRDKIADILAVFPKMSGTSLFVKFKKFNALHNWFSNTPKIDNMKPKVDKIVLKYIELKNLQTEINNRPTFFSSIYKINCRPIRDLLSIAKDENEVIEAMEWLNNLSWVKDVSWNMHTILKKFSDFLKTRQPEDELEVARKRLGL